LHPSRRILDILEETILAGGATTLDLTGIYADLVETACTEYCHLTPDGNRLLAQHVAPQNAFMLRQRVAVIDSLASSPASG
jgi:hypothetical protein